MGASEDSALSTTANGSTTEVPVDDILQEMTDAQNAKLQMLWVKLDNLTSSEASGTDTADRTTDLSPPETEVEIGYSKAFKKAIADLTPKQLRSGLWSMVKQDDPDTLLVRFLRARKWDVDRALTMLVASMHWRLARRVEEYILPSGDIEFVRLANLSDTHERKIGEQVLAQLRSGKSFAHGTDRHGRPLVYIRVRLHRANMQSLEALERFIIFNAETARMLLRSPNTTAAVVFDMTEFGMANMDWNALRLLASGLADNYPESLGGVYILRAPWIVNGIWSVVRGWLDPEIASKVHFLKDAKQLEEFVDLDVLPKSMGGKSEWEPEYIEPNVAEPLSDCQVEEKKLLEREREKIVESYEEITRKWARQELDDPEGLMRQRRVLFAQLKANYWKGDRYWRGESLLDRTGVIGDNGAYNPLAGKVRP